MKEPAGDEVSSEDVKKSLIGVVVLAIIPCCSVATPGGEMRAFRFCLNLLHALPLFLR